jgi:hypothetical protein
VVNGFEPGGFVRTVTSTKSYVSIVAVEAVN